MPMQYNRRDRSRSPRRSQAKRKGCLYCGVDEELEFGRDMCFCSLACYRLASRGADALQWEPKEVTTWLRDQGLNRWVNKLGHLDGYSLFISVNEGSLTRLGVKTVKARDVMRSIESLRQGAWSQPEPPLKDVPLATVAVKGQAQSTNWHNVLEDLPKRSYAALCRNAIDQDTAWSWFEMLKEKLPWQDLRDERYQVEGKTIPRRTIFVVDRGCSCVYGYSGVKVPPLEEPDFVAEIRRKCAMMAGFCEHEMPNACNINLYRDGHDSVGWHTDNEPLFEAEYNDACILSLSLGATRNFALKLQPQVTLNGRPKATSLPVHNGDLCTMEGKFQRYYLHAVPKEVHVHGARINLTWRWITKHSKDSGCKCKGPGNL